MASNSSPESRKNWGDNVFRDIPVGENEPCLLAEFLAAHDLADNSRRAIINDLRKFADELNVFVDWNYIEEMDSTEP